MSDCKLELSAPAWLVIVAGGKEVKIDPYVASRKIRELAAKGDEWPAIRQLLADYLSVPVESIAENQAQQFDVAIAQMVEKLDAELKKTNATIACSPPPTQESNPATETGPTGASEPGSPTSATAA